MFLITQFWKSQTYTLEKYLHSLIMLFMWRITKNARLSILRWLQLTKAQLIPNSTIGLLVEKKKSTILPPTMTAMAGSWLLHLLLSHPLNSPELHKPATFGGKTGINIIKTATLKKLICLNLSNRCKHVHVAFQLPNTLMYKVTPTK